MPLTSRRFATVAAVLVTVAACGGSSGDTTPAPQCTAAAQCPGTDTGCQTRTCVSGACGFSYAADTVVVASQVSGDCHVNRCDGAGGVHAVVDDADAPADDGNACTSESCASGVPVHPPLATNTACAQSGGSYCDGAGACVECTEAAQCGGDTECRTFTCFAGSCGVSDQVPGTTVSSQTPGDCKSNVCDGFGEVTSVSLDSDVPADDGNTCTSELCNAGAPGHPPVATSAACNQNGGTVCDGAGSCVACNVAADCGTSTPCKAFTCTAHICESTTAPPGTVAANPTAGDCRSDQCDGNGSVVANSVDNADVPADEGNQCTAEVCAAGAPTHPARAAGAACNQSGGSQCNGTGTCVQCLTAADCGTSTACRTFTCNAGLCGSYNAAAGTVVANPTVGDCRTNQCDGAGSVTANAIDATDVPADDGNQCTVDTCTSGSPVHPVAASGTACNQGGGTQCNGAGSCVQCLAAADCGTNTACKTFTCNATGFCGSNNAAAGTVVANPTAGDCRTNQCDGAGSVTANAIDGTDVPADEGNQCTAEVCTAGAPTHPARAAGAACNQNGGTQCNGTGTCVQCLAAADCGTSTACKTFTCNAGVCGAYNVAAGTVVANPTIGDCRTNQCDGAGSVTANAIDGTDVPMDDGNQCTLDTCTSGSPVHPVAASGTACNQGGGTQCNGAGSCVQCLAAADCGTNTACKTFTCSAGVCGLNNTPAGTVVANPTPGNCRTNQCDGLGSVVTNAVDNTDLPADDGNQCTLDTCTSGTPGYLAAASGAPCNQSGGTVCDGAGACRTEPAVAATMPPDGGTAAPTTTVAITFTEAMAVPPFQVQTVAPFCTGSVQLSADGFATCAMFSIGTAAMSGGNRTATFFPEPALLPGRTYQIRVTTGVLSAFGIAFPSVYTSPTGFATTTVNETGIALEADYCDVAYPSSMTVQTGTTTPTVYGKVYENGVTEAPGPSASITAELGYGPRSANPELDPGWSWFAAGYHVQSGSNDEYQTTFTAPAAGTYGYAYRFSLDGGTTWTYCDADGAGSNTALTFDLAEVPVLTVTP